MVEDTGVRPPRISLGFTAARGFAGGDLTSPARAAEAGAFVDTGPARFERLGTELRIHGVSGSNGPTMLEHPVALQVAGDGVTQFYRRWTPAAQGGQSAPWRLEAYSWGGLTEKPLAAASWILLAPFMLYNVAHFMLPAAKGWRVEESVSKAPRLSRDRPHAVAQTLLRVLALTATLQLTLATVSVLVNTIAVQARNARFPSWLDWYPHWTVDWRVRAAAVAVGAVIAILWLVSVRTANRYEARASRPEPHVNRQWPLTQPGFWKGQELVRRQRSLHAAGAVALTALVLSRPVDGVPAGRLVVAGLSALVLVLVVVTLCLPLADRHNVSLAEVAPAGETTTATWWCRIVLGLSVAVLIGALLPGGWSGAAEGVPASIPGLTNICLVLLATQLALLAVLAALVAGMARGPSRTAGFEPFFRGHLATLIVLLALCLGGLLSALANVGAARLLGVPVPSGVRGEPVPHALQIPWPIHAFAAVPIGLLLGVLVAAGYLFMRWRGEVRRFATGRPSPVANEYGTAYGDPDAEGYRRSRGRIARAWAVALLADRAAVVAGLATAGMTAAVIVVEVGSLIASHRQGVTSSSWIRGLVGVASAAGLIGAGMLVTLLRSAYRDPTRRRTFGALWDVATFWPRATHPFAPPCYGERAVPEVVDRIRILTGTVPKDPDDPAWLQIAAHERDLDSTGELTVEADRVLLTGYSQGSIIAPAVVAQLPAETRSLVSLLTIACPARRLYGRAFPGYFGPEQLDALTRLLDGSQVDSPRWKNLVRHSDYIGSWIFTDCDNGTDTRGVDQLCLDPVAVTADRDPTPPPIHRHSNWWPDTRVEEMARPLLERAAPAQPAEP
jgi:hypothetical protein